MGGDWCLDGAFASFDPLAFIVGGNRFDIFPILVQSMPYALLLRSEYTASIERLFGLPALLQQASSYGKGKEYGNCWERGKKVPVPAFVLRPGNN